MTREHIMVEEYGGAKPLTLWAGSKRENEEDNQGPIVAFKDTSLKA
jgi:hypothetical protein